MNWFYFFVLGFYLLLVLGRTFTSVRDYSVTYTVKKKMRPTPAVVIFAFPIVFLFIFVTLPFKMGLKL